MNVYEFVLALVFIVTIGKLIESRRSGGGKSRRRSRHHRDDEPKAAAGPDPESLEKIKSLEERIKVLERIVTDQRYELREKFRDLE